jgi:hypothetical protein
LKSAIAYYNAGVAVSNSVIIIGLATGVNVMVIILTVVPVLPKRRGSKVPP